MLRQVYWPVDPAHWDAGKLEVVLLGNRIKKLQFLIYSQEIYSETGIYEHVLGQESKEST